MICQAVRLKRCHKPVKGFSGNFQFRRRHCFWSCFTLDIWTLRRFLNELLKKIPNNLRLVHYESSIPSTELRGLYYLFKVTSFCLCFNYQKQEHTPHKLYIYDRTSFGDVHTATTTFELSCWPIRIRIRLCGVTLLILSSSLAALVLNKHNC